MYDMYMYTCTFRDEVIGIFALFTDTAAKSIYACAEACTGTAKAILGQRRGVVLERTRSTLRVLDVTCGGGRGKGVGKW
jgi:hypothetical protein